MEGGGGGDVTAPPPSPSYYVISLPPIETMEAGDKNLAEERPNISAIYNLYIFIV